MSQNDRLFLRVITFEPNRILTCSLRERCLVGPGKGHAYRICPVPPWKWPKNLGENGPRYVTYIAHSLRGYLSVGGAAPASTGGGVTVGMRHFSFYWKFTQKFFLPPYDLGGPTVVPPIFFNFQWLQVGKILFAHFSWLWVYGILVLTQNLPKNFSPPPLWLRGPTVVPPIFFQLSVVAAGKKFIFAFLMVVGMRHFIFYRKFCKKNSSPPMNWVSHHGSADDFSNFR